MFGLGIGELIVIGIVALLVLGPEKLPEAARSLGKALHQFRRAGQDLRDEVLYTPPEKTTDKSLSAPTDSSVIAQPNKPDLKVGDSLSGLSSEVLDKKE